MDLPNQFEKYLRECSQVSQKTLRNYRSDLSHFSKWAFSNLEEKDIKVGSLQDVIPYFTAGLVVNYKTYQAESGIPNGTVNRRLSTLRSFSRFLLATGFLSNDPTQIVENVQKEEKPIDVLAEFKTYMEGQGLSKSTLKNYLSDARQFLSWAQNIQEDGRE